MTDQQEQTGDNVATPPVAQAPVQPRPEGQKPNAVPLTRFNDVNERRKAAETELANLRKQLEDLRKQPPPSVTAEETEPDSGTTQEEADPRLEIDPARYARLEIQAALDVTEDVAEMIRANMAKGLDLTDATALARAKNPAAFRKEARGYNPQAHAVSPPAAGRPKPQPEPTVMDKIASARGDLHRRQNVAIGFAAQAVRAQMQAQFRKNQ